jgi:pimeloyl-ACP methyl ester carboxylesterase
MKAMAYDEFGLLSENAAEYGFDINGALPRVRKETPVGGARTLSSIVWGTQPANVLLHGGAQNAHTWDTFALALGRPSLAIDLPGHGHSGPSSQKLSSEVDVTSIAADVWHVVEQEASTPCVVIGMSLGGLTAIKLVADHPGLVSGLLIVDVTPSSRGPAGLWGFVNGPATFDNFDQLLAHAVENNPTRTESSLRRGLAHNAFEQSDGSWMWRHRRFAGFGIFGDGLSGDFDFTQLWTDLARIRVPILLVRGMQPSSAVTDAEEERFVSTALNPTVRRVPSAGHNVQGDAPLDLAEIALEFIESCRGQP